MEDPTSMMSPLYQGRTCDPPALAAHPGGNCTLGGFPSYAINASSVRDVQTAVNFARNTGIRLVVKNTGHDFSGKSGGAGALSIWTHHMKDIEFVPAFKEDGEEGYEGPAFKCGTGVQAWEIFEAANAQGLVVVGGEGRVSLLFRSEVFIMLRFEVDCGRHGRIYPRRRPLATLFHPRHSSRPRPLPGSRARIGKVRHGDLHAE